MNCCKGFSYSPLSTCHLVDNKFCLVYNYDVSYTNLNYTVLHCTAVLLYVMMYMYVRTVGSCYYTAPEVLAGSYDYRCDTWSLVRHISTITTTYLPTSPFFHPLSVFLFSSLFFSFLLFFLEVSFSFLPFFALTYSYSISSSPSVSYIFISCQLNHLVSNSLVSYPP